MVEPTIVAHTERRIPLEAVRHLYTAMQWWPERTLPTIAALLDTSVAVGAWHGDELVGFARAVTDEQVRAYMEDVAVLPDYQRQGIGEQLLWMLLDRLQHIETISLFCHHGLVPWYERVGFKARMSQTVMHRQGAFRGEGRSHDVERGHQQQWLG